MKRHAHSCTQIGLELGRYSLSIARVQEECFAQGLPSQCSRRIAQIRQSQMQDKQAQGDLAQHLRCQKSRKKRCGQ